MIFSFSRLKQYETCPAAFSYKYLLELPEAPSEPLVLGKAVHTAIEKYLNGDDMDSAVQASVDEAQLPLDTGEVRNLAGHPEVQSVMGGTVEQHFALPLDDSGSVILQGYIDWWNEDNGGVILKDWKTNRIPYQPIKNHQLGLYAWALSQQTGAAEVQGELVFLRYSFSAMRYNHAYNRQDMSDAREWALKQALEIKEKLAQVDSVSDTILFPDRPGVACQHCGYSSLCIRSAKIEPVTINGSADATKVAAEVIRLESALGDMKDKLKIWARDNGDIAVGDSAYSFVPSTSWSIGSDKLYDLCAELHDAGIDVFQYLTLTAANLKKLEVGDDRLEAYGKKKTTQTFRLVKAKEAC